jgi:predicted amidohydrolase
MILSAVQLKTSKNVEDNVKKAVEIIESSNADLIVFPELFNTGYYPENYRKSDITPVLKASEDSNAVIVAGMAEIDGDDLYNTAFVIHRGRIIGKHRKTKLFPLTHEVETFKAGDSVEIIKTPIGDLGIMICYEVRFPEIARRLTKLGAKIIAVLAVFPKERIEHWKILLRARAIENQVYVVGANCVNESCGGNSMIIDPLGNVLAEASCDEGIISAEIDPNFVDEVRRRYPFLEF